MACAASTNLLYVLFSSRVLDHWRDKPHPHQSVAEDNLDKRRALAGYVEMQEYQADWLTKHDRRDRHVAAPNVALAPSQGTRRSKAHQS